MAEDTKTQQEINEYIKNVDIKNEQDLLKETNLLVREFDSVIQFEQTEIAKRFVYIHGRPIGPLGSEGGLFDELDIGLGSYHLQRIREVGIMREYLKESKELEDHRRKLINIQQRFINKLRALIEVTCRSFPMQIKQEQQGTEMPKEEANLSPRQKEIIYEMYEYKDRAGINILAQKMGIAPNTVGRDFDVLEQQEMIERTPTGAQLTRKGLLIAKQVTQEKRFIEQ